MDILIPVTFIVAFLSSIVSGMSGGGGGFIMTPYYLLIGLSPQQIVAGASIASLGLGSSSLIAMRGKQLISRKFLVPLIVLTITFTLLAMLVLPKIQSGVFEIAIGTLLIILAPTLFINKASLQSGERSRKSILLGYISYAIILFASSLGGGLATLLFLPLMFLMGLSAMQSNALRRVLMLIQAVIAFFVVLPQGYIVWSYALAALIGCYIGGHIGTKIALKRGENFIKYSLAAVMVASGLILLIK
ncbi:MAG TPA: sulfite exporter TauE/SafE family protein [Patescibacteria group bacterium]|nr:sulfite exporter TauE/SafE family protein [Patescibacteria group bacterium]